MSMEEINKLNVKERVIALNYSWSKFNLHRPDLALKQLFGSYKGNDNGKSTDIVINMTDKDISRIENELKNTTNMSEAEKNSYIKHMESYRGHTKE